MPVNKSFLNGLAKLSILILLLNGAVFIPFGRFLMGLPCLTLRIAGWGFLGAGVFSLWHLLRLTVFRLFR